jgi:hypothetical protein
MYEPLTALAYVTNMLNEPEKTLEACKEIFDSLGPLLIYNHVPAVFIRMLEANFLIKRNFICICKYGGFFKRD